MSTPVITGEENDNLAHIRNIMIKFHIGRVVIVREGRVRGMVTWTDLIKALISREKQWATRPIDELLAKEVMTANPVMIRQTKSVRLAAKTMIRYKISGLPVVDAQNGLAGIITKTDVVRAIPKTKSSKIMVSKVMTPNVITASPNHTLYRAASLMTQHGIAHLIIKEANTPVGIISKMDLASFAPAFNGFNEPRFVKQKRSKFGVAHPNRVYLVPLASDLMATNLLIIRPEATLAEASQIMLRKGISCLPVVDENDSLLGVVTKSDLVRTVARFR
jgi:CBS domain-containing protein